MKTKLLLLLILLILTAIAPSMTLEEVCESGSMKAFGEFAKSYRTIPHIPWRYDGQWRLVATTTSRKIYTTTTYRNKRLESITEIDTKASEYIPITWLKHQFYVPEPNTMPAMTMQDVLSGLDPNSVLYEAIEGLEE